MFWLLTVVVALTEQDCLTFLTDHMSLGDASLSREFLLANVKQALSARESFPWSSSISDIMFLNDVLPFASLLEPRDLWRSGNFTEFMAAIVSPCLDIPCAVHALNARAWNIRQPAIIFEPSPSNMINSYSPLETILRGNSSCTGLAIFLVDALRAVGVPARLAGTPHWNLGPEACPGGDADAPCGNHNWVEAFLPGRGWSFVDQRRPDLRVLPLNQSFFAAQATRQDGGTENHTIFAASFAPPEWLIGRGYWAGRGVRPAPRFPMVWDWADSSVHAWQLPR